MNVKIKKFEIEMEVKNKGMELEIRTADGSSQLGDLKITKTGLQWCKGRAASGKKVAWDKFIAFMEK